MSTRRRARILIAAIIGTIFLASCTPEQMAALEQLRAGDKFAHVLSDAQLARLRACESGGNYSIASSSGTYRGAYQFNRATWNGVAARHYPYLVGHDPATAQPHDQDRMARALWAERGRQPWPHCGRRV